MKYQNLIELFLKIILIVIVILINNNNNNNNNTFRALSVNYHHSF